MTRLLLIASLFAALFFVRPRYARNGSNRYLVVQTRATIYEFQLSPWVSFRIVRLF